MFDVNNDHQFNERIKQTVALVEANSNEQHLLWREWAKESTWCDPKYPSTLSRKFMWEQMNPGCWIQIGTLAKMPVCISLSWNRLDGQVVLFWELTSMVTDSRMAEKYLKKIFGKIPTYDNGHREATTDANNFHLAAEAVREARDRKK